MCGTEGTHSMQQQGVANGQSLDPLQPEHSQVTAGKLGMNMITLKIKNFVYCCTALNLQNDPMVTLSLGFLLCIQIQQLK